MAATVEATPRGARPASAPAGTSKWLEGRNRLYVYIGGAIAIVALVALLVVLSERRKQTFAERALDQATNIAQSGNLGLAASELQKVITTYSGTAAAQEAVIRLNQVRLVNGQQELAAVGLQEFIKSGPSPQFLTAANGLLGRALENSNRPGEAAAAYLRASQSADVDYLKAEYLMDAGRAYVDAKDSAKAIATYQGLLKDFPNFSSKTEAEVRLAELTGGAL